MKRLAVATFLLAGAVCATPAFAGGGLLQNLPKDGSWTKYNFEMKGTGPAKKEISGTFTLKSVGQVTENGKTCRWIEFEMKGTEDGKERHAIIKMLVNVKQLKPGSKEAPEVVRGWNKAPGSTEVKELSDSDKNPNGPFSMFFGANRKDVKKLKKTKTVDYQKGQLKISDGTSAKLNIDPGGNAPANFSIEVTQSIWPHKSIPFGTAAMELHMTTKIKGQPGQNMTMKFTVQDYGSGAKSALPDKN